MKRTWKDAACDLAWNCFKRASCVKSMKQERPELHDEHVLVDLSKVIKTQILFIVYEFIKFQDFKKKFFNWLENKKEWWEDNE
ncbi:MAG: hypothetical protein QMC67_05345 [Candidatus Wallbacteria bacterium]